MSAFQLPRLLPSAGRCGRCRIRSLPNRVNYSIGGHHDQKSDTLSVHKEAGQLVTAGRFDGLELPDDYVPPGQLSLPAHPKASRAGVSIVARSVRIRRPPNGEVNL